MLVPHYILKNIVAACDSESCRFALGCVLFERDAEGKCFAVSTDARRLIVANWDEVTEKLPQGYVSQTGEFKFLLHESVVRDLSKIAGDKSNRLPNRDLVFIDESTLASEKNANHEVIRSIAIKFHKLGTIQQEVHKENPGRFPKWRDVCGRSGEYVNICMDAEMLESTLKACRGATPDGKDSNNKVVLTVPVHGDTAMILSRVNCVSRTMAIQMPLGGYFGDETVIQPVWHATTETEWFKTTIHMQLAAKQGDCNRLERENKALKEEIARLASLHHAAETDRVNLIDQIEDNGGVAVLPKKTSTRSRKAKSETVVA